jgi:hypothetical protein
VCLCVRAHACLPACLRAARPQVLDGVYSVRAKRLEEYTALDWLVVQVTLQVDEDASEGDGEDDDDDNDDAASTAARADLHAMVTAAAVAAAAVAAGSAALRGAGGAGHAW